MSHKNEARIFAPDKYTHARSSSGGGAPKTANLVEKNLRFKLAFFTGVKVAVVFLLVYVAFFGHTRRPTRNCFVVDALRHHVPGDSLPRLSRADKSADRHEPVMYGQVCFDTKQLVADWRLTETFSHVVRLTDVRLCTESGETVMAMGLRRGPRASLSGSTIIDEAALAELLSNHSSFYVAAEGKTDHVGDMPHEVARGRLQLSLADNNNNKQ